MFKQRKGSKCVTTRGVLAGLTAGGGGRLKPDRKRLACRAIVEQLEERRLLSVDSIHLIGITGNQQGANPDPINHPDETLWDIKVGQEGSTETGFMDGWSDAPDPPSTVLSISTNVGVTHGPGALRVAVPQDSGAYWGIMSPNIVGLLRDGAFQFEYDMTLNNIELNGGSFAGTDNAFVGYAQSNELSVQISTQNNGWIQRDFSAGGGVDSLGQGANWNGVDGTRHIIWNLNQFTSEGMSLKDFVILHNPNEAHFWLPTQGAGDDNGHTGPMRFYFDNFQVITTKLNSIGDFDLISTSRMLVLPTVPDTDAIGFNPELGLLNRTSGSESYSNNPNSAGYRDNQFMETIDPTSLAQTGIFNSNYEGSPGSGPFGVYAPRPTWVLPADRRTDEQNTDFYKNMRGPDEYHGLRDLTWSTADHLFYGTDERGIFTLTPEGQSTHISTPFGISGGPKGITFHTFGLGDRRLLVSERSGPILWTVDPATGEKSNPLFLSDSLGNFVPGILSLVDDPTSTSIWGIARVSGDQENAFNRELIKINPVTGEWRSYGNFGFHMADLAFVVPPPSVVAGDFLYENAPQRLSIKFDQMMKWSIASEDLTVERLGEGGGPVSFDPPIYDDATNTVTFSFPGILPDGNYRATLGAGGVRNDLEMSLSQNKVIDFFVLSGDLNHDRTVSIADFIHLASNFNKSNATYSDGDVNYDGSVTIADFIALASSFNKVLDPPPAAAAPAALSISSGSPDSAEVLATSSADVVDKQEVAVFSRKAHKKHAHHRRHGHKSAPHWISRAGAY